MLGTVFEQLNAYKDGSVFTPGFITSYMCRQSISRVVVSKFNAAHPGWHAATLADIEAEITRECRRDRTHQEAFLNHCRELLFSIRICDPAVGSGHFLYSALNEMILVHYKLGLMQTPYFLDVKNDRLETDFTYTKSCPITSKEYKAQKELFLLKQKIIENNLFGVDINPNSAAIARLRLWIELLKHSYYTDPNQAFWHELEVLPNIDINIKCGNSLLSYFALDLNLKNVPNIRSLVASYRTAVANYKDGIYDSKDELRRQIRRFGEGFANFGMSAAKTKELDKFKKSAQKYSDKYGDFLVRDNNDDKFKILVAPRIVAFLDFDETDPAQAAAAKAAFKRLKAEFDAIYYLEGLNPFEWRFEFPEVLGENGEFLGFDLIIANPPYLQVKKGVFNPATFAFSEGKDPGKQNLYKVFVELAYNLATPDGNISLVTQSSIMCDLSAQYTRELLLRHTTMHEFIEFKKNQRIFTNIIQGVAILQYTKTKPQKEHKFGVIINHSEDKMDALDFEHIAQSDILKHFPRYEIPLIKRDDMGVILKIKSGDKVPLKSLLKDSLQGNINTIHLKRIQSPVKTGVYLVKGANIHRYFIDMDSFMNCVDTDEMRGHYEFNEQFEMIAMQGITGTADRHRIHCCPLSPSKQMKFVCLDSTKILFVECKEKAKFLCGILNSSLINFLFRVTSTNNNVNLYELEPLPIPQITPKNQKIADEIVEVAEKIMAAKSAALPHQNDAHNSTAALHFCGDDTAALSHQNADTEPHNADTAALEAKIDELVYQLYGLDAADIAIINGIF